LFFIVEEGFSIALKHVFQFENIKYMLNSTNSNVSSRMSYGDDVLIFCKDKKYLMTLKNILRNYDLASGQWINIEKK